MWSSDGRTALALHWEGGRAAPDLGLNKAERLVDVLGLLLHVDAGEPRLNRPPKLKPLTRAAATASVSSRTRLVAPALKRIDDAPVSLLGAVAEQLHAEENISCEDVWKNYRTLARQVKNLREIWG